MLRSVMVIFFFFSFLPDFGFHNNRFLCQQVKFGLRLLCTLKNEESGENMG